MTDAGLGTVTLSIPVEGGALQCEISGTGPAVVFIHGFTLDRRMWDDQFSVFARNYRAVRYDVRGFGKSPIPRGFYSHAADLAALMDYLEISVAALVGLSMGGAIALDFAVNRPERTRALVLADSSIGAFQLAGETAEFSGRADCSEKERRCVDEMKTRWLADEIFRPAFEMPKIKKRLMEMVGDYSGYHWLYENPCAKLNDAYFRKIRKITAPTLVIVGERDAAKHRRIADLLAENIDKAMLYRIKGAGHVCNMERPDQFNDAVEAFLKSVFYSD